MADGGGFIHRVMHDELGIAPALGPFPSARRLSLFRCIVLFFLFHREDKLCSMTTPHSHRFIRVVELRQIKMMSQLEGHPKTHADQSRTKTYTAGSHGS